MHVPTGGEGLIQQHNILQKSKNCPHFKSNQRKKERHTYLKEIAYNINVANRSS